MTHSIFYEVDYNNCEKQVLEELNKVEINISKIPDIIDNIKESTVNITKAEIAQIVKEIFVLFREYLYSHRDFRLGWTYPKLVINNAGLLLVQIPNIKFIKEDRSFLTEEQVKYFAANAAWKLKRKGEWAVAKEKLHTFLEAEINDFRSKMGEYTPEALCAMIVSLKFFKEHFDFQKEIMKELAARRAKGDAFAFEEYIKKEFLNLPKATLNFDDFAAAFKEFKL